jgi:O-antigen ligase
MSETQRRWLERGGWLAAFLLPLLFNPLALNDPFEPTKTLFFQMIVLGMAVVAVWPGGEKEKWWLPNPLAVPVWLYGVIVGLATAVSIDARTSLWGSNIYGHGTITTLALLLFFFLLTTALRHTRQIDQLINIILIGSVPVALYGLIQYAGLDPIEWSPHSISPIHSTMGRSNYLGSYLAMIIPFTLVRLIQSRADAQRNRLVAYGILLLLQLSCLLFTLARGAWLGFTIGIVLFAILLTRQRRNRLRLVLLLLIVGLAVVGFITNAGWQLLTEANIPFQLDLSRIRQGSDSARLVTARCSAWVCC